MDEPQTVPPWLEGPDRVVLDARLLRSLAHPLRIEIVSQLRHHGPATATTLAVRLRVNTGTTSYHLRQLAAAGLVVEDDERGNARDRWWKAAHQFSTLDDSTLLREEPELTGAFLHAVAGMYAANLARYIDELPTLPKVWQDAGDLSDFSLQLTARQLASLRDELHTVLARYRTGPEAAKPRGSRQVTVQLQAFPRSG